MMKGTPCSGADSASLKTSSKTRYLTRSVNPAKRVRAWAHSGPRPFCDAVEARTPALPSGNRAPYPENLIEPPILESDVKRISRAGGARLAPERPDPPRWVAPPISRGVLGGGAIE
jgi:hypothetical protein